MKLKKEQYKISKQTLEEVLEALQNNWFTSADDEDYNYDDIMDAQRSLEIEIESQNN